MTRPSASLPAMSVARLRSGQPMTQSPSISLFGITVLSALRPHAELRLRPELRPQPRLARLQEPGQIRPGLARVDQVLDAEPFRGQERRIQPLQFRFDFLLLLRRIV